MDYYIDTVLASCGCEEPSFVAGNENSESSRENTEVERSLRLAHPRQKQNRNDEVLEDTWSACNGGAGVNDAVW
eukprot:scaffold155660_cov58-Attheya_sp.AAC.1